MMRDIIGFVRKDNAIADSNKDYYFEVSIKTIWATFLTLLPLTYEMFLTKKKKKDGM